MIDNCFCSSESWINIRRLHFNANLKTILKVFFSLIPEPQLYTITHMAYTVAYNNKKGGETGKQNEQGREAEQRERGAE